ncbi:MAG: hypothetical protein V3U50_05710, partial [Acidimicrobiia bacterium]
MKLSDRVKQARQDPNNVIDLTDSGSRHLDTDDPIAGFKLRLQQGLHEKLGPDAFDTNRSEADLRRS